MLKREDTHNGVSLVKQEQMVSHANSKLLSQMWSCNAESPIYLIDQSMEGKKN